MYPSDLANIVDARLLYQMSCYYGEIVGRLENLIKLAKTGYTVFCG